MNKTFLEIVEGEIFYDRVSVTGGVRGAKPVGKGVLRTFKFHVDGFLGTVRSQIHLRNRLSENKYRVLYFAVSDSVPGLMRNLATASAGKKNGCRVISHVHSGAFSTLFERKSTALLAQKLQRLTDTFVFLSPALSEDASRNIPRSKHEIVPNTLDPEVRCKSHEVKTKIASREVRDEMRVLYLSNMIESKGYWDVAKAVRRFNAEATVRITVDFIGAWPTDKARRSFERKLQSFGLGDTARVRGKIEDRTRVRQAYLDADVFVLPTYYPTEAQPVTIIEAMNAATPIIATPHASIPEYVNDDENGYIVDKKSPGQIYNRLKLLTEPENWKRKARAARRTYKNVFAPGAVREKFLAVLRGGEV
ncbi:glycosyltransferase involved in cell wall biosynthesis [Salinibacter ruber]|uniref:glycosyltransferase family 4 protein n=1 Tax=Salinibacter ruber TaxID=146919 RepID=UPI0021696785|nr:glycosyltransferase family 4 protein [Salinibacter ruber]MCS3632484.1 glycosyltransferase involved in cell wall biosynthesis [Salinibacter ruber]